MPELVEDGDRRLIVAGRFRLVFLWSSDRWVHTLELGDTGEMSPRVLAVSLESDPKFEEPTRVVSPTYQDLQFQDAGDDLQALLVGQAGPHHFSAVFTIEERPGGDVSIDVDVADRCRGLVEALATTYTIDARSEELVDADSFGAAWDFEPGRLTFAVVPPARFALAEAGRRATQIQALADSGSRSATRRFRYQWHWQTVPFEAGCHPGRE
jgi:hypothetical protein